VVAAGTMFLSRTRIETRRAADGTWMLQMLLMDRQAPQRVEPWRVLWGGPQAQAWHEAIGRHLGAGTALQVQCTGMRTLAGPNGTAPELHARLIGAPVVLPTSRAMTPQAPPTPAAAPTAHDHNHNHPTETTEPCPQYT
jgi:hypothetical protein